jgi:type IV pilus assembly protein PilE
MQQHNAGVSLIELLMVIVIIGILTSIAVPGYRAYMIRTNRTEAKTALLAMAGNLERCFTRFSSYNDAGCTVDTSAVTSESGKYLIDATTLTATTFVLTAVPQAGQNDDTGCANLTLDQLNARGRSGTKPVAECWGR